MTDKKKFTDEMAMRKGYEALFRACDSFEAAKQLASAIDDGNALAFEVGCYVLKENGDADKVIEVIDSKIEIIKQNPDLAAVVRPFSFDYRDYRDFLSAFAPGVIGRALSLMSVT